MVSASPFRATLRVDASQDAAEPESDEEFDREELPELQKSHMSPIKDDSVILRQERNEYLNVMGGANA